MRIVVVGASVAGVAACQALRSEGWQGEIVLVGDERDLYDRPPLSKSLLLGTVTPDSLSLPGADQLEQLGIVRRAPARAEALDLKRDIVTLDDGELAFDGLIIATGSHAKQPPFPAVGVHLLRSLDDALRLRRALREAGSVVVVGAGFIGLEVASSARELGLEVSILEYAQHPLARVLPPTGGRIFAELHAAAGTSVRCGVEVVEVDQGVVRLTSGELLTADVVVAGVGAAPNDGWLADSELRVRDGVVCDASLRAAPRVYAAGDIARWAHPDYGEIRVEHWTSAREHARVVAANLAAELCGLQAERRTADTVPYFWSDQLGVKVQLVGFPTDVDAVHLRRDGQRQMLLLGCGGRLSAVMTLDWPRELAMQRRKLAAGQDFGEAVDEAPGTAVAPD